MHTLFSRALAVSLNDIYWDQSLERGKCLMHFGDCSTFGDRDADRIQRGLNCEATELTITGFVQAVVKLYSA